MNLSSLFEIQKALDERIVKEKGLEGQNLLPMKILALQVELGECANEWRGFKFWSNDREPRTEVKETVHGWENGMPLKVSRTKNPLIEEYVDCLHFILSIGLELNSISPPKDIKKIHIVSEDVLELFGNCFWWISEVDRAYCHEEIKDIDYYRLISVFIQLGEAIGFTWEEIEQAYLEKNQVNHNRQAIGY